MADLHELVCLALPLNSELFGLQPDQERCGAAGLLLKREPDRYLTGEGTQPEPQQDHEGGREDTGTCSRGQQVARGAGSKSV
jgi:hypothetical protein